MPIRSKCLSVGTAQCSVSQPIYLIDPLQPWASLPSPSSRWRCDEAGRLCPSPRRLHRLPTSRGWHYWTFLLEIARSVHLYRIGCCSARLLRRFCLYSVPSHEGFPSLGINIGRYSLHRKCLSACNPYPSSSGFSGIDSSMIISLRRRASFSTCRSTSLDPWLPCRCPHVLPKLHRYCNLPQSHQTPAQPSHPSHINST